MVSRSFPVLSLFDGVPLAAAAMDGQGNVLSLNAAGERAGLRMNLGSSWTECVLEEQRVSMRRQWQELVPAGKGFELSFRGCAEEHETQWVMNTAPMTGEPDCVPSVWICTFKLQYATSRDRGDLADASAGLRAALRAGGMALWEWTPETDQAMWSPLLYDMLEIPAGDGLEKGERFLSFLHPEDKPIGESIVQQLMGQQEMAPTRFRIVTGKGNVRWLLSCGQAQRDASGQLIRITGVNQDVTDQELSSQRLKTALADASRRASILQAVMEHAPVGIALSLESEPDISFISKAGVEMIESTIAQAQQWDTWQVYHVDGLTPARKEEMALHRATQGEVVTDEEWLIRRADGHLLPVRCHAGAVLDQSGQRIGGVVAWYDITPFKQAAAHQEDLRQLATQAQIAAEKANTAKDHFLAMLSHELRNPLAAILNWAQVLLSGKADADVIQRGLEVIRRNARDQSRLIDDLLDVSRIVTGKLDIRLKRCDLSDVLSLALETVRPAAHDKRIELLASLRSELPVSGDPLRLQQVMWNLLSNAIKFSPSGSTITVTACSEDSEAVVTVDDQGKGLSAELLPHVFERFRQGPAEEDIPQAGLGLGLAIAAHIIERHRGTIKAESAGLGKGASFIVRLPLV